jgi:CTP:molybdopterin cytidylyltransferase MocA
MIRLVPPVAPSHAKPAERRSVADGVRSRSAERAQPPVVGGIVLAAGASRRAGYPKALALLFGRTFVARVARTLHTAGCDEVIVVVGPPHGEAVAAAARGCRIVVNPSPGRGMLSSLKLALREAHGWDAAVVALVDQPLVRTATVRTLLGAFAAGGADLVRPRLGGRTGHPILISRTAFGPLLDAPDPEGARPVLRRLRRRLDIDVDDPRILHDLDTAADLARAGATPPRSS